MAAGATVVVGMADTAAGITNGSGHAALAGSGVFCRATPELPLNTGLFGVA